MHVLNRTLAVASVLLGLSLFAGCQPACQSLCDENSQYVESCLEHWEAVWPDFGYDNAADYQASCRARVSATIGVQPVENQREIRLACAEDLALLTTSVGCNDYQPNGSDLDPTENDNGVLPRPAGGG